MITIKNADEALIISEAIYFVQNNSTVRETAEHFKRAKTTVHEDITEKLKDLNVQLYRKVRAILRQNADEASMRGVKARLAKRSEKRKI